MGDIVVTGCSTGIGRATASRLAKRGHRVFAGVRHIEDAASLVDEVGPALIPLLLDVTDAAAIERARADLERAGVDRLDGLVNNAGVGFGGPSEGVDLDRWRQQFEVNLFGPVAITQTLLPLLRAAQGRVVFVSSVASFSRPAFLGPYAASKAALDSLAGTWRQELTRWGIAMAVVRPGVTKTPIWDKSTSLADEIEATADPEMVNLYRAEIDAMRRMLRANAKGGVDPDVVARAVEHALTARRPRLSYDVGPDTKAARVIDWLLPERGSSALFRRFGSG